LESAAVVVARRGKNASAPFSSARRRAIPDARSWCLTLSLRQVGEGTHHPTRVS
jgi:hypothetical protein